MEFASSPTLEGRPEPAKGIGTPMLIQPPCPSSRLQRVDRRSRQAAAELRACKTSSSARWTPQSTPIPPMPRRPRQLPLLDLCPSLELPESSRLLPASMKGRAVEHGRHVPPTLGKPLHRLQPLFSSPSCTHRAPRCRPGSREGRGPCGRSGRPPPWRDDGRRPRNQVGGWERPLGRDPNQVSAKKTTLGPTARSSLGGGAWSHCSHCSHCSHYSRCFPLPHIPTEHRAVGLNNKRRLSAQQPDQV